MAKVAAIQMVSSADLEQNLKQAKLLIEQAVAANAKLIVLPEEFAYMGSDESDKFALRENLDQGPIQLFLKEQASKNKVWIIGGTLPLRTVEDKKIYSACIVYNDSGERVACYHKIHLFDAVVDDNKRLYCESSIVEPGNEVVVVDTPVGRIGLAVCYDLRFPELFRLMHDKGVEIFALPAAFTAVTGKVHWELLLRARAVENLCYMLAANQGGSHENGRETYGHSMIISPWGETVVSHPSGPGFVVSDVDVAKLTQLRKNFPVITHRKL